jgi:zona occludens toxin (predicted ATPase)
MSIVGYSGLPGSGKSYGVVENVVIPALESGRHIITNIPLKTGRLSDDFPQGKVTIFDNRDAEGDPDFFSLEGHPAGVIWIIDEAWRFWKSGMKSVNIPQVQKEFFTEHRHMVGEDGRTNEIVLVTQDLQQLCAFVRDLVEETYRAVKLTAVGQKNRYRVDVYQGGVTGQKPGKPMRQLYGKYKPEIYQYYKSHTRNKTDFAAGMEEKADDRANVLKHPLVFLPRSWLWALVFIRPTVISLDLVTIPSPLTRPRSSSHNQLPKARQERHSRLNQLPSARYPGPVSSRYVLKSRTIGYRCRTSGASSVKLTVFIGFGASPVPEKYTVAFVIERLKPVNRTVS